MYVKTEGPPDARIMLVGEAPGADEDLIGRPFQGYAGQTLNKLLSQAGIARSACLVTNVARERPPGNKIAYFFEDSKCTIPKPMMINWISTLKQEIELYKPNVVVALGATALWALTGEKKISKYRGAIMTSTLVPGLKVIATYHPQNVNYEWKNYQSVILDFKKALRHSITPNVPVDSRILIDNATYQQFKGYLEEMIANDSVRWISADIETNQPGSHISMIGLSHSGKFGISFKFLNGRLPAWPEREEIEIWRLLAILFKKKELIGHNFAFDSGVLLHNHGIFSPQIFMDTLIAAHILWPELPRDLGYLASICLDVRPWKETAKDNTSLYNAEDACNTYAIAEVLYKEIRRQNLWEYFEFEMSEIEPANFMQLHGADVDTDIQKQMVEDKTKLKAVAQDALSAVLKTDVGGKGHVLNLNSHKQLQKLLYYDLGLPIQYKRRKRATDPRKMTSNTEALKRLQFLVPDNPIFKLIMEWKKLDKLIKDFIDIDLSPEKKVHTCYNITGSKTEDEGRKSFGRWSSSESIILPYGSGNLQNIPPEARKIYRAPKGKVLLAADYIQAEAVVVAWLTNDQNLKKMIRSAFGLRKAERKKYDIHIYTAATMFRILFEAVTKEQREIGKRLRHSGNYASGPGVVATNLGCKLATAKSLIELYHRASPTLRLWHMSIQDKLKQDRTLVTPLGRKHRFLDQWGDHLFRSAYSYIPQSTVGDLMNMSLVKMYRRHGDFLEFVLQLHDAVYTYIPDSKDAIGEAMAIHRNCMLREIEVNFDSFMIDVDFKVGPGWGDLQDVDWQDYV